MVARIAMMVVVRNTIHGSEILHENRLGVVSELKSHDLQSFCTSKRWFSHRISSINSKYPVIVEMSHEKKNSYFP